MIGLVGSIRSRLHKRHLHKELSRAYGVAPVVVDAVVENFSAFNEYDARDLMGILERGTNPTYFRSNIQYSEDDIQHALDLHEELKPELLYFDISHSDPYEIESRSNGFDIVRTFSGRVQSLTDRLDGQKLFDAVSSAIDAISVRKASRRYGCHETSYSQEDEELVAWALKRNLIPDEQRRFLDKRCCSPGLKEIESRYDSNLVDDTIKRLYSYDKAAVDEAERKRLKKLFSGSSVSWCSDGPCTC